MWKMKDFYLIYRMWTDEEYRSVADEALLKGKEMDDYAVYKRGSESDSR